MHPPWHFIKVALLFTMSTVSSHIQPESSRTSAWDKNHNHTHILYEKPKMQCSTVTFTAMFWSLGCDTQFDKDQNIVNKDDYRTLHHVRRLLWLFTTWPKQPLQKQHSGFSGETNCLALALEPKGMLQHFGQYIAFPTYPDWKKMVNTIFTSARQVVWFTWVAFHDS